MAMLDEIGQLLQDEGVATLGTDLWLGEMQPDPDASIALFETPGGPPEAFDRTDYPSLQVRVRDLSYTAARTRIEEVYTLLHGLAEVDLSGTRYHLILAKQTPFSLGQTDRERHELVVNFAVTRRNSGRTTPSGR